ncbi:hypothetical protein GCM10010232_20500 [Streptomyces amakusaensis]|uniref:Trypsin-like peptidase domain-containing protein n=1 Tax=Streptomyces amakusaensis TaxID=67271 RepID=A0ABW0AGN3_9ACTN
MNAPPSGGRPGRDTWVASIHLTERDGKPLGTGILIDGRRVLTCAHVVETAWKRQPELWIALPKAEEAVTGRVRISGISLPPDPDHEVQDVAVLRLAEEVPAALAARLRRPTAEALVGAAWRSFGFPDGVLGNSAGGSVGEALGYGWIRLDTSELRYPVKGGYSGAAVWSPDYQAVVGMVGQAHATTGDARALTIRALDRFLPDQQLRRLTDRSAEGDPETASASWDWSLGADPETGRHWNPRARGVSTEAERGFRFRGRATALRSIAQWLEGAPPRRQVLVVTGAPGVGKSAVLGRIVTTADEGVAASLPPGDTAVRAPLGSVSCAVHAKGKTALEVAQEIARAASAPPPAQVLDLLPSLRESLRQRPERPFTLIVDALDEAGTPDEARAIIRRIVVPLAETCADLGARVVVGTRRRDPAGDLLGAFGRTARLIDLDTPEFSTPEDLTAYALTTLQLHGDERLGNPYADTAVALPVAARIAGLADGNFLVAGLVARAHGVHDEEAVHPESIVFPVTLDAALREYLRLLPDVGTLPAEKALTPLAYAEAPGPTMALWRTALNALFGTAPPESDLLAFARSSAANFLVETAREGAGDATFRLFHQALNDSLRAARADVASTTGDERALAYAYIAEGTRTGWADAPAYLLRSLPLHAGRGGAIDRLLAEDDYPLHADLRRLIPQTRLATTDHGRARARLLRQTPRALDAPAPERAALFSVTEVQERLGTTYRTGTAARPYRAVWSTAAPSREVAVLEGHTKQVTALCFLRPGGRNLLASAGEDAIRLWDPDTGDALRTLNGYSGWISSLCAVETADRTLLAGAGQEGTVWLWDPDTGEILHTLRGHDAPIDQLCTVHTTDRALLVSRGRDRRAIVWDPATGNTVRVFRTRSRDIRAMSPIEFEGRAVVALLTAHSENRSQVRLWDPVTSETVRTFLTGSALHKKLAAVPCQGRSLLAISEGVTEHATITLWDASTGRVFRALDDAEQDSPYSVMGVRVAGESFVVAGYGHEERGQVVVWNSATGRRTHRLEGHGGWVGALCAVESGGETLIASAGQDCTVRLWDIRRSPESDLFDGPGSWIASMSVLEVNGWAAVASSGTPGAVPLHDAATGTLIDRISTLHARVVSLHTTSINGRAALAIASSDAEEGAIQLWDSTTGEVVRTLAVPKIGTVCPVEIGGRPCIAIASRNKGVNELSLWDFSTDEIISRITGEEELIQDLCALEAGGRVLVAVLKETVEFRPGGFHEGALHFWDPILGELGRPTAISDAAFGFLCVLEAGERAILAIATHRRDNNHDQVGTGAVCVIDPVSGRILHDRELHNGWVNSISPVKFGTWSGMASAGQTERSVRLWSADGLRKRMDIPVRREVSSVVQADGHLVFGLGDGGLMAVRLTEEA